jgi:hypothetical protein
MPAISNTTTSGRIASRRRNSAEKRLSLVKALKPGIVEWRKLITVSNGQLSIEPLERACRDFNLDPTNHIDWKILAAVLADHLLDEGNKRGRHPWTTAQKIELLTEVHRCKQNNAHLLDERVCELIAQNKKSPPYFRGKGSGLVKQLRKARRQFQTNSLLRTAFLLAFEDAGRN